VSSDVTGHLAMIMAVTRLPVSSGQGRAPWCSEGALGGRGEWCGGGEVVGVRGEGWGGGAFIAGGRCVGGDCGQREGERAVMPANGEARADVGVVQGRDVRANVSIQRGRGEGSSGSRFLAFVFGGFGRCELWPYWFGLG
jgi:hypothetical protein